MCHNYTYDAFGEEKGRSGSTENNFLFAGEQFDRDLGDYYLRDRFYDAEIGRFGRRDTYEGRPYQPITLNTYIYANDNPLSFVDPTGLNGELTIEGLSAAVAIIGLLGASAYIAARAYEPESLGGFGAGHRPSVPNHTGHGGVISRVLELGRQGFGAGSQPSVSSDTAHRGWQNTLDGFVSYVFNHDSAQNILLNPDGTPIGARGTKDDIRVLPGGFDAAKDLFDSLAQGGTIDTNTSYPGTWIERPYNGGGIGLRVYATRSPGTEATVDVNIPGIPIKKLKFTP